MHDAGQVLRDARRRAGLTQARLADRAGVTQPVVSRAEAPGSNPRVETLDRLLRAAGARLELVAVPQPLPDVDEAQLLAHLRMSPAERIRMHDAGKRNLEAMLRSARRVA